MDPDRYNQLECGGRREHKRPPSAHTETSTQDGWAGAGSRPRERGCAEAAAATVLLSV